MNKHDCYVVDGCVDFIPVKMSTLTSNGVEVTIVGSAQKERVLVDKVYQMHKFFEPHKVVVPKYIADKIEYCKDVEGYGLFHTMDYCYKYKDPAEWLEDNQETFARAWLDGYEVEQEKLYVVEIADAILTKITRGSNIQYKMLPFGNVTDVFDKAIYTTRLTEREIKQKDERLWQWAKEVKNGSTKI